MRGACLVHRPRTDRHVVAFPLISSSGMLNPRTLDATRSPKTACMLLKSSGRCLAPLVPLRRTSHMRRISDVANPLLRTIVPPYCFKKVLFFDESIGRTENNCRVDHTTRHFTFSYVILDIVI